MSIFDDKACCDGDYPLKACVSLKHITCHGEGNGEAAVTVYGGLPPFSFQWSDPNNSVTQTVQGLPQGSYTVRVTDQTGMIVTVPFSINEPDDLTVVVDSYTEATFTQYGEIELTIDGGIEDYSFDLQIDGNDTQVIEWCAEQGGTDCGCSTHCCTAKVSNTYVAYADDEIGTNMSETRQCTEQTTSGALTFRTRDGYEADPSLGLYATPLSTPGFGGILNKQLLLADVSNGLMSIVYDVPRDRPTKTIKISIEKGSVWNSDPKDNLIVEYVNPTTNLIESHPVDLTALDSASLIEFDIETTSSHNWNSPNLLVPGSTLHPVFKVWVKYNGQESLDEIVFRASEVTGSVCQCYRAVVYTDACYDSLSPSIFSGSWELINNSDCAHLSTNQDNEFTDESGSNGIYSYTAFASDSSGTDFNLVQGDRCYVAYMTSTTDLSPLDASDFSSAVWVEVCNTSTLPNDKYINSFFDTSVETSGEGWAGGTDDIPQDPSSVVRRDRTYTINESGDYLIFVKSYFVCNNLDNTMNQNYIKSALLINNISTPFKFDDIDQVTITGHDAGVTNYLRSHIMSSHSFNAGDTVKVAHSLNNGITQGSVKIMACDIVIQKVYMDANISKT